METDEIESLLSQQMRSMETTDRETIVKNFKAVLDIELPLEMCTFFLEMSGWNLQDAIGAYYDHGEKTVCDMASITSRALNMQFVKDHTIGEGETVSPSTKFVKTWLVRNNGVIPWPEGTCLAFRDGIALTTDLRVPLNCQLLPNDDIRISIEMESPAEPGMYQSVWQLVTEQEVPFGERIWCIVQVEAGGILDITQQLARTPLSNMSFSSSSSRSRRTSVELANPVPIMPIWSAGNFQLPSVRNRSIAVSIQHDDATSVPPSTPCTPPDERMD